MGLIILLLGLFLSVTLKVTTGEHCTLKYRDCGSKESVIKSVMITTPSPCQGDVAILPQGQTVMLNVTLKATATAQNLTTVVHGIIAEVPILFPIKDVDGCKDKGIACPTKNGVAYNYGASIAVETSYPKIKLVVKWELKDQDKDFLCFLVPAQITAK